MEAVFVLFTEARLVGVYTSHMKAIQAMIMDSIPFGYQMSDYTYQLGVEFFTFTDSKVERTYEIQEVVPDKRV